VNAACQKRVTLTSEIKKWRMGVLQGKVHEERGVGVVGFHYSRGTLREQDGAIRFVIIDL
jgi:hypothetical protein